MIGSVTVHRDSLSLSALAIDGSGPYKVDDGGIVDTQVAWDLSEASSPWVEGSVEVHGVRGMVEPAHRSLRPPAGPVTVPAAASAPATVAANDRSVVMAGGVAPEQAAATGQPDEAAPSSAAAPARTEYVFSGDPTTIDANEWPSAGTSPDGKQLYYFAGDTAPGDAKGTGGQWTVYTPA